MQVSEQGQVVVVESSDAGVGPWLTLPVLAGLGALLLEAPEAMLVGCAGVVAVAFALWRSLGRRRIRIEIDRVLRVLKIDDTDGLARRTRWVAFDEIAAVDYERCETHSGVPTARPVLLLQDGRRIELAVPTTRIELLRPVLRNLAAERRVPRKVQRWLDRLAAA